MYLRRKKRTAQKQIAPWKKSAVWFLEGLERDIRFLPDENDGFLREFPVRLKALAKDHGENPLLKCCYDRLVTYFLM